MIRREGKPLALAVRVNRSVVVRKALLLGLDALERSSRRPDVQTSGPLLDDDEGP